MGLQISLLLIGLQITQLLMDRLMCLQISNSVVDGYADSNNFGVDI